MSALEDEIIQKFRLLDASARSRVLLQLQETDPPQPDEVTKTLELLKWGEQFRAEMAAKYGHQDMPSIVDLLNEAREERLNDIMGGS